MLLLNTAQHRDNEVTLRAIRNAATASTGLTAITLKPGSSLALVGDGTSAWYQYSGTSIAVVGPRVTRTKIRCTYLVASARRPPDGG